MTKKMKLISLLTSFALIGCALDVDNPNSLLEADLGDPSAAGAVANGGWNATLNGVGYIMIANAVAGDEVVWTGSRDAWRELDNGGMTNVYNEFVDGAWPFITEGRWMADKAVSVLEAFQADGSLPDSQDLVRAYLTAAMVRVYIADMFDDFVYSDKTVSGTPFGEAGMSVMYDEATALLGKAASIATGDNVVKVTAMKARVAHAKAVWGKVNPVNTSSPYVNAGTADAAAALALMDGDYKWKMIYGPGTVSNDMSWQINGRLEMDLVDSPAHGGTKGGDPIPNDLVTGAKDTRILAEEAVFRADYGGTDYAPITIVSAREMHLIIAEGKMAGGDAAGTLAELNKIRALDGLAEYTTEDAGAALQHERRANLFIQGKRLPDMYRFGHTSTKWVSGVLSGPGVFFPIPISEIRSNDNITQ